MAENFEQLTFFCQLCDASIDSNICPRHGIDFVTIKKITQVKKPSKNAPADSANRRINGMLQLGEQAGSGNAANEKRIATPQQIKKGVHLPVIPTDTNEEHALTPLPELEEDPQDVSPTNNPYRQAVEKELHEQLQDYHGVEPGVSDYYEAAAAPSRPATRPAGINKGILAASITVIVLLAAVVAYVTVKQSAPSPTSLYSQAESFYNTQNYPAALQLYQQFIEKYPDDPLVPLVNDKISSINRQSVAAVSDSTDGQPQLKELMLKANIAFQKEQYVRPEEDNVIAYTTAILKMDPTYQPALDLHDRVIAYYQTQAEAAMQKGRYNDAIGYYHTILEIKPNDAQIISKIHSILTQKDEMPRP